MTDFVKVSVFILALILVHAYASKVDACVRPSFIECVTE